MLFGVVVFLAALLLFQVQLIAAKHVLPWFGGTPAVWTTSQMFFQVLLLGGYAYAHALASLRTPRLQYRIHVALLIAAVAALSGMVAWTGAPLLAPASLVPDATSHPVPLLLMVLLLSVGLPFFVVSTTGPLMQAWHSRRFSSLDATYRLYAVSNAGSFIALVSYPLVVELLLDLPQQAWLWMGLFAVFAIGCAVVARRPTQEETPPDEPASPHAPAVADPTPDVLPASGTLHSTDAPDTVTRTAGPGEMVLWLALSCIGSVAFLATTNQLTHDVAAVPFLWALPLSIYLLTFVLAFDRPAWYSRRWTAIVTSFVGLLVLPDMAPYFALPALIAAHSIVLLGFCLLCHGELSRARPGACQLTLFYLLLATGGALGGVLVSVVAPLVLTDFWEFGLVLPIGWAVVAVAWLRDRTSPFHRGDRSFFAWIVAIPSFFVVRFVIEVLQFGPARWLLPYGWWLTALGTVALTASVCAVVWRRRFVASPVWAWALVVLLVVGLAVSLIRQVGQSRDDVLYAARNFYGVVKVMGRAYGVAEARQLVHGTTLHGVELNVLGRPSPPTAYYSPSSGIAAAVASLREPAGSGQPDLAAGLHIGVVGMGVGTMAAFTERSDRVRFYEINDEVIRIAQGPYFTFLSRADGEVAVVPGDGRLSLERELRDDGSQRFDLLAMDAFSSDAVPVHLITIEAFRVYAAHLRDDRAIVAVNVTNRHLELEPVVAANARALGFHAVRVDSAGDRPVVQASSWILLARDASALAHPAVGRVGGRPLRSESTTFTDQYSNLLRVLK